MLYIAYGSNLHLEQMGYRCPDAEVAGKGVLKGYDLLFRGYRHSAVATVEPLENGAVPVLLWDISRQDERSLDRYEGWPSFYRKEIISVEFNGGETPAMIYIMNRGPEFGTPSEAYYNTIREGYESAGFDLEYLENAAEKSAELAMQRDKDFRFELCFDDMEMF